MTVVVDRPAENVVVISVAGEVDLANSQQLEEAVLGSLRDEQRRAIVDLTSVDLIDSTGLNALLVVHQRAHQSGGIRLIAPAGPVRKVLELTSLDRVFATHTTAAELWVCPSCNPDLQPQTSGSHKSEKWIRHAHE